MPSLTMMSRHQIGDLFNDESGKEACGSPAAGAVNHAPVKLDFIIKYRREAIFHQANLRYLE